LPALQFVPYDRLCEPLYTASMRLAEGRNSADVESRKERAYRYIRSRILSGALPGGEVLSELSLSKEVGRPNTTRNCNARN